MDRREFLRQVALWSAGAAAAPLFRIPLAGAAPAAAPVLAVAEGKDYAALVTKVLAPLGGIAAFVKKGHKVVVKPNIGWDRNPDQAANTHPEVVKALVKLCLEAGAAEVRVFDRTCNEERRCYATSGIQAAVGELHDERAICEHVDNRVFIPVKIEKGKVLKEWQLYKPALEADCFINLPIAKHHSIAKLTLGLKNMMGIMGGDRGQIHGNIGPNLADVNTVARPHLTLIDATRILLRRGPQGGSLKDVQVLDTLIASTDIVAADAYATTLFKLDPKAIPATVAAYQLGLGEMDLAKVEVKKA